MPNEMYICAIIRGTCALHMHFMPINTLTIFPLIDHISFNEFTQIMNKKWNKNENYTVQKPIAFELNNGRKKSNYATFIAKKE